MNTKYLIIKHFGSTARFAHELGVSASTANGWLEAGRIPAYYAEKITCLTGIPQSVLVHDPGPRHVHQYGLPAQD